MENILKEANILKQNLDKAKIKDFNYNPFLEAPVSLEHLNNIKSNYGDVDVAKDINNNANRIVYIRNNIGIVNNMGIVYNVDNINNMGIVDNIDNIDNLVDYEFENYITNIENEIQNYTGYSVESRGLYLYPPNGYCGWHTNSKCIGERLYLSWCKEGNKSFFRYVDPETNELHTIWEKEGWNINRFKVSNEPDKLLWHCVYSDTVRISMGFNCLDLKE